MLEEVLEAMLEEVCERLDRVLGQGKFELAGGLGSWFEHLLVCLTSERNWVEVWVEMLLELELELVNQL